MPNSVLCARSENSRSGGCRALLDLHRTLSSLEVTPLGVSLGAVKDTYARFIDAGIKGPSLFGTKPV